MQSEFCVQMLAQPCSRLMWALVGQHSASPAAAPRPRLAVLLVRSMRWIDFSWQNRLRLPSRKDVVPCSVCQVDPPLKPRSPNALLWPWLCQAPLGFLSWKFGFGIHVGRLWCPGLWMVKASAGFGRLLGEPLQDRTGHSLWQCQPDSTSFKLLHHLVLTHKFYTWNNQCLLILLENRDIVVTPLTQLPYYWELLGLLSYLWHSPVLCPVPCHCKVGWHAIFVELTRSRRLQKSPLVPVWVQLNCGGCGSSHLLKCKNSVIVGRSWNESQVRLSFCLFISPII